ncbi:MAG TPA: hypothetical protein VF608_11250, partial [Thermoanaerobaculia bacterium]
MHPLTEALLQSAADPTWIVGAAGTLVRFNVPFARLYEDVHGHTPESGIRAEGFFDDPWPDLLARTLGGRSVSTDTAFIVGGLVRSFSVTCTPVVESNTVTHAVFAARELPES